MSRTPESRLHRHGDVDSPCRPLTIDEELPLESLVYIATETTPVSKTTADAFQDSRSDLILHDGQGREEALSVCEPIRVWLARLVPPGGHVSNICNMASNTLGVGIIGMPAAFHQTGLYFAGLLLVVCAVMVVFSFYLLGVTCERTPFRSWESACRGILFRGSDYVVAVVMLFFQFGSMVGFVTAVHQLLQPFFAVDSPGWVTAATVLVWACFMFSLSLPRRLASLRYVSLVGVTMVVYFVFAVAVHASMAGLPHLNDMKLFADGLDAVNGVTTFLYALLGHGLVFRLYDEAPHPSARGTAIDGCGSVALVGTLYLIIGFFGNAEFGADMTGSIFHKYAVGKDDTMMTIAYMGVLMKVCVAYALTAAAARLPVYYLIGSDIDRASLAQHLFITVPLCLFSLFLGLAIPDVNVVFSLLGSICGGCLAFLLPAYFVMYLGGWTIVRCGWLKVGMTYVNIVAGVVAIVFGTAMALNSLLAASGG